MSVHVQPDLFGEYDERETTRKKYATLWALPLPKKCPYCLEPSERYNGCWTSWMRVHGYHPWEYYKVTNQPHRTKCHPQSQVETHIAYAVWRGAPTRDLVNRAFALNFDPSPIILSTWVKKERAMEEGNWPVHRLAYATKEKAQTS